MSGESVAHARETLALHFEALIGWGIERLPLGADRAALTEANPAPQTEQAEPLPPVEQESPPRIEDRAAFLQELNREVVACRRCRLCEGRTQTVFGTGNLHARLLFVGEAPGYDEDQQGEPFVGKAGQLLNKMILAMGLKREETYICNVVKCRPPQNRTPLADEMASCSRFLFAQIRTIRPEVIVALGKPAANCLLSNVSSVGSLRGRQHSLEGIPVIATYHPAYLLRNPPAKKDAWADLQLAMRLLSPG